jgi:hypothetical protein
MKFNDYGNFSKFLFKKLHQLESDVKKTSIFATSKTKKTF